MLALDSTPAERLRMARALVEDLGLHVELESYDDDPMDEDECTDESADIAEHALRLTRASLSGGDPTAEAIELRDMVARFCARLQARRAA